MVAEYRRRFWIEEGFRDVKWTARICQSADQRNQSVDENVWITRPGRCWSWQVSSARVLLKDEKKGGEKMREVASRRKGGWDISLIRATIKLLKRDKSLYNCLNPFIKLNLCNTLQNVS